MATGKRIRHLQRYRAITTAFTRSGFGYVTDRVGWDGKFAFYPLHEHNGRQRKSNGLRVRQLLEELGTTFVKLGQIASTRPDLIPPDIIDELSHLQDHVPAFSFEEAAEIIEEELGAPVEQLFRHFNQEPLAAASIGQVHKAVLQDGTEVVVKVQRPNIGSIVETDLEILADLARVADRHLDWSRSYRLSEIIDELGKGLLKELDYRIEAGSIEKFAIQSKSLEYVRVPTVYWDYSTKKVLTMEYIDGIKLADQEQLKKAGLDLSLLAKRLATTIFNQILVDGLFHADPHPGNVLALPDGSIALLDFGMVGKLSPHIQKHFASFIIALRNKSSKGVIRAISELGMIPEDVNMKDLYADVDEMREKYYNVPLKEISMGEIFTDLLGVAFRHSIRIPSELTLVGKSILTTEGVAAALDPNMSVFDVAEPIGKKLYLGRLNPFPMLKEWLEDVPEYIGLLRDIPATLKQVSVILQKGKLQVEVASPQLEMLMKKLDRISNQMSFSIVLLALSIVMLGLIIGSALSGAQPLLWKLPIIEISSVIALLMFLWLIYAIFRSGRF
ncbi:putative protein kinase UbiB [compost metagenome]